MIQRLCRIGLAFFCALAIYGFSGPASAADSFEVSSMKAVRPTLVNTLNALQQKDIAKARAAFEDYDSAWNGIEVYINTRSKEMYNAIELDLQARINKELEAANPDYPKLIADVQQIIAKYDEAIAMVEKGKPLNPLFDDVAKLRMERAHLREVLPALKAGNLEKARKSYQAFDAGWDPIEDLVKARSEDAYVAIEKAMIQIEQALMADKPNVTEVTNLINGLNTQYNNALGEIVKEARSKP
jgi:tetratricopeptide (TPR) repeat protein